MTPQDGPLPPQNDEDRKVTQGSGRRVTVIAFWAVTLSALLAGLATFALAACKSSGP